MCSTISATSRHPISRILLYSNGVRRTRDDRPNKRSPITPQMLLELRSNLRQVPKKYRASFWAVCTLAFTTLLRISNLLPEKENTRFLRLGDVKATRTKLCLTIQLLKYQRFLAGATVIPVRTAVGWKLCPVAAFNALEFPPDLSANTPLISYVSRKGKVISHNATKFTTVLKTLLKRSGYNPGQYSLHSF